jgi:hypothetical protein
MKRLLSSKARPVWALLAFLIVLLPLVVFLIKHGQSAYRSGAQPAPPTLSNSSTPDFSTFVGEWYHHGGVLIFSSDGRAKYVARAYRWCGPGVSPPCDSMQNNIIIDGINEEMLFTYVVGNTAYGTITASSAGDTGRAVTLATAANDTATLTIGTEPPGLPLCGPHAPVGSCGA